MIYQEFLESIKEEVQKQIGTEGGVVIKETVKTNGTKLDGLMIVRTGERAVPIHYLNDYYEDYKEGKTLEACVARILKMENEHIGKEPNGLSILTDWNEASPHLFPMLINSRWNQEFLEKAPHRELMDLAIVYYVKLEGSELGEASVKITNEMLRIWEVTEEDLYDTAIKNMINQEHPKIKSMSEVMREIFGEMQEEKEAKEELDDIVSQLLEEVEREGEEGIYVLTNPNKVKGAAGILITELLRKFAEGIGKNFYILPSSVHEVLLVPDNGNVDANDLREMVKEVNLKEVAVDEVLSDKVYYFEREKAELRIA